MSTPTAPQKYDQGKRIRLFGTFNTVLDGTPIDPTTVYVVVLEPDGTTVLRRTYGDGTVIKTATGAYYTDVDSTPLSGWYSYRWYSTGTGQSSEQFKFLVVSDSLTYA